MESEREFYHVTKTEFLSEILEQGLIPGVNYDRDFYGIAIDLTDLYAPKKYQNLGVLRKNVVFVHLKKKDSDGYSEDEALLAVKVDPQKVYVSDRAMIPFDSIWNRCLSKPFFEIEQSLKPQWTNEQSNTLFNLFEVHLLDKDFFDRVEEMKINRQLVEETVKIAKISIETIGRKEIKNYWRRVVSLKEFESEFIFNKKRVHFSPIRKNRRVIYDPEGMIIGSVPPEKIRLVTK